jgi:hypothetical protein
MIHSNGPLVGIIPSKTSLGHEFSIGGIICPSNPSWIVTPDHKFEVESLVWLKGNPELSLWVNRVCGVGKDYVMFDVSDTHKSVSSKTKITWIIAILSLLFTLILPMFSLPTLPWLPQN